MRRDLIKFFIFAALFLGVLHIISRVVPVPKPRDKDDDEKPLVQADAETVVHGFAAVYAVEQLKRDDLSRVGWQYQPRGWLQVGAIGGSTWAVAGLDFLCPPVAVAPHPTLGELDDELTYHMFVVLDRRGASIRRLVLNKFETADTFGRPDPKAGPLELIPDIDETDYRRLPANVLYHYDLDNRSVDRPLDTLGKREWDFEEKEVDDGKQVSFTTVIQGVRITKTFTLKKRTYHISLEVKLQRLPDARKDARFRYQLTGATGLPIEGRWYTSIFRHALIGLREKNDLWRSYQDVREIASKQGGDLVRRDSDRIMQYAAVAVQYFASVIAVDDEQEYRGFLESARPTLEAQVVKLEASDAIDPGSREIRIVDKKNPKKAPDTYRLSPEVHAELLLNPPKRGDSVHLLVVPDANDDLIAVKVLSAADAQPQWQDDITVRVNTETIDLSDSLETPVVHKYLLYNGPVKPKLLGQMRGVRSVEPGLVDRYTEKLNLNTLTDYHSPGFMGKIASFIYLTNLIIFFTNLCHGVLGLLHSILPSWGICIILLTLLVRGMMLPLSRKQARTTMKMQELAPELKKLKEKYKDDRQAFAMAQMDLFRKHGVNPLGTCWMLLLQMPIFMGLYYCLQESVFFRLAGFLWIENLAAPDMLLWWGQGIPLLSRPESYGGFLYLGPYLNLLPIVAVTLMLYQQKKMMPPPTDDQQAMQMKIMKWMMIVFGLIFYKVAAGLCLYFIVSSLWGFAERKFAPKKKIEGAVESAESLFSKLRGEPAVPGAEKAIPASSGDKDVASNNRAKRRQERKQRQRLAQTVQAAANDTRSNVTTEKPAELQGWWGRMRNWWQEVLKKAAKK